ncbi:DUF459 domain-containing protein [Arsenicitalea aurantiaca]|uniref:DUF459 domain-containing protein n=1 Tax=Arsenicitalea aurantiaca TaxID=1783274 RepID=A0A433XKC3_9HYPH|nr:DUF459 domain-containing protein [Arsenicitalea aurantiaca]RUT34464.1 DUF459 domain-containing protein [Arsenicitalea aurantiaca]
MTNARPIAGRVRDRSLIRALTHGLMALVILVLVVTDLGMATAMAEDLPGAPIATRERIEVAQVQRRRTLMDMLFGPREEQQRPPVQEVRPPVQQQQRRQQTQQRSAPQQQQRRAPAPQAALPPPTPTVEKNEDATRLAVFGDSMASDLARALERAYAEDPNIVIIGQGVGSSGFVRDDFFNWPRTIGEQITADSFDLAVVMIGINDRQPISQNGQSLAPLSDEWVAAYQTRVSGFIEQLRRANKPVIWVGLPPMEGGGYGQAMAQISSIQRLASYAAGAEFVDIYERFLDEEGRFSAFGPDISGQRVRMRKDDNIHLSAAGADKVAFYLNQSIRLFYRGGGGISVDVADALEGTDAQSMLRPPYQGLGQIRLLEVAGAVISLTNTQRRAGDLISASASPPRDAGTGFSLEDLVRAPEGRADAFGVGFVPDEEGEDDEEADPTEPPLSEASLR